MTLWRETFALSVPLLSQRRISQKTRSELLWKRCNWPTLKYIIRLVNKFAPVESNSATHGVLIWCRCSHTTSSLAIYPAGKILMIIITFLTCSWLFSPLKPNAPPALNLRACLSSVLPSLLPPLPLLLWMGPGNLLLPLKSSQSSRELCDLPVGSHFDGGPAVADEHQHGLA